MKTKQENKFNLKVGDVIIFTTNAGYTFQQTITRITESSIFHSNELGHNSRESLNTFNSYFDKCSYKIN